MKFGCLTNSRIEITEEIKSILSRGFDFVEIGIEWPEGSVDKLKKKSKRIKKILKENNIFAIGHTAWWIDLANPYEEIRKAWLKESFNKILIARRLGIKLLSFHFYSRELERINFYSNYQNLILQNFVKSLNKIVSYGRENEVEIMLENVDYKGQIGFQNYLCVLKKIPSLKVHLDIAHAYISGGMTMVQSYIRTFKNRIVHLHLHDNHGQFDEHLPIGKGTINYRKVVNWLKRIDFDQTATLEVFTSKQDAKNSMLKIKNLWNKI